MAIVNEIMFISLIFDLNDMNKAQGPHYTMNVWVSLLLKS